MVTFKGLNLPPTGTFPDSRSILRASGFRLGLDITEPSLLYLDHMFHFQIPFPLSCISHFDKLSTEIIQEINTLSKPNDPNLNNIKSIHQIVGRMK